MSSSSNTPATATVSSSSKSKAAGTSQTVEKRKPLFQKELQHMMYGFGDEQNPLPETMALVEDIVVEYVTNLVIELSLHLYNNKNIFGDARHIRLKRLVGREEGY